MTPIELAAVEAFRIHIRNAIGTRSFKWDAPVGHREMETFDEAVMRRWENAAQRTREEFIETAKACFAVFQETMMEQPDA